MKVYENGDRNKQSIHEFLDSECGTSEKYDLMVRLYVGENDTYEVIY